jgi:hypothetical protein
MNAIRHGITQLVGSYGNDHLQQDDDDLSK